MRSYISASYQANKIGIPVMLDAFSVCATLESHVDSMSLSKVCSKVFRCWEWSSNANLCTKGCRIILGWNKDVVDVLVFIYAGNNPMERRQLWSDLELHKNVVCGSPWILMGDFNVSLNIEDSFDGSSLMNSAMCDFKDCVKRIEVIDINSIGLHFTWNQKLKGKNVILKKLDRIMGNIEFVDMFPGAYARFQPYRISDHSPAVLNLPSFSMSKPKPFKFYNFFAYKDRVLEVVIDNWSNQVEGHSMYRVVVFRKLLHEQGNLHDCVNRLSFDLNEAKIDEESRNQRSRIDVIHTVDSLEVTGTSVPDVFVSHYEAFLCASITNDEIKSAMFDIGDNKAPGPDRYTSAFFKKGCDVVGQKVCMAVRNFFDKGQLLKEVNHTFLALIPKVTTPLTVNDYRPISCCNVLYKCISKILTNRIIEGIKEVVSENHPAFIPGRRISDNILLTQELMHNYHRDRGPPRCAFKVDIQKAYDTANEAYDKVILFLLIFFTLVMEILTLILQRRMRLSDSFRYHKHCEELQLINLCFVNDLFLFARGDVESAKVIMESLDEFKQVSGLVPSIPKSTTYFCNVLNYVKISILNIMPFSEGELLVIYLGVPLISSRLLNKDCKILVEKARNRIGDRKNKSLSFAGRLQLCKSVISSMQVYWASVLAIPIGIIYDIQQLICGFLWCNGEYKCEKAKVAWDDTCLPMREGCLGIRCLKVFNLALMTTHIWNIVSNKESLWVRWIHMYKLRGRTFWDICPKANMSWGWRKILQLRDIVKPYFWMQIGNGLKASIWYDLWCAQSPLYQYITTRDIAREGHNLRMCVADIMSNGDCVWPQAWLA
ncbi:putative RNA-directed DNA polymerase, eukaryota, reverse transcriptase zinc-binding domain protein, partial [Tanacetum coccineum]